MRLQVLDGGRLSLVEEGETVLILEGKMSLRISPTELRPEVMFLPDSKLPSSFHIGDEVVSDGENALLFRRWQPLRADTTIVTHDDEARLEARIAIEADDPADDPDMPF
ncbi:hypothetical protein A3K29_05230 [Candidatus Collierbacteria bacterium RIFOXYB2_FULL_46_14]|uniref:Uncharacterized protein n=1 Tax=Candidatus Collierbacteria bacterium GW2011_GWA2_46_26 TaxID=1618381 RepID=A0A0G1PL46_9BACT|nr:MAG: hypothetical protein UX47_C0004G0067 [Candidatus Collierbacteria bacterium GW2011_GWA2_46_26]OGD73496.1 MAG: hypothetical protein A3K29_05230 [Candidatus Collierbacteria bacterium RIFOXYB2_FULL_46_14]OGD76538.1 MAG: hypothetical protein A3K43_05230 [Candidatus Collierbacteria bacterium RIFOXYA2_FULL_46_20]OGD77874.1 MAG: hypothetical protein A3K39_05230 [Candidatus Collierbacteria bacterium RIFOXYC2_FULL_43_15]OGD81164.1 MAG: hypothetical protein A2320_05725 [Pseudomonadales bacterium G